MNRAALKMMVAGACLAMAASLDYFLFAQLSAAQIYSPAPSAGQLPEARAPVGVSADALEMQDFLSRPLFLPSRRPAPKPQAEEQSNNPEAAKELQSAQPEPSLTLLGVVVTPGGREAIVRDAAGATTILKEGAEIGPWLLKRVADDRAIFLSGAEERALLFAPHNSAALREQAEESPAPSPPILRRRP